MKYQPNANYSSNDVVYTPPPLASAIVEHYRPSGKMLDPCKGSGAFLTFMPNADWCEISEGRDFFDYHKKVDWIISNPPWSKIRDFLNHSYSIADNIVYLITINHAFTKARLRDMKLHGFGIAEIALCDTPKNFPQSGFQLAAIHWKRGATNVVKLTNIDV